MAYLGYSTIGAASASISTGFVGAAGRYQASENGTATAIEVYTDNYVSNFVLGIYADSGGVPGALLATTTSGLLSSVTLAFEWRSRTLVTPLALTAGTYYWIGSVCDGFGPGVYNILDDPSSGKGQYIAHAYDGVLPNPFGSGTLFNIEWSTRILYTPTGSGGTAPSISSITPAAHPANASVDVILQAVQIAGSNLTAGAITFSDANLTVSGTPTVTASLITFNLRLAAGTAGGAKTVTVTTGAGSATVTFTVGGGGSGGAVGPWGTIR